MNIHRLTISDSIPENTHHLHVVPDSEDILPRLDKTNRLPEAQPPAARLFSELSSSSSFHRSECGPHLACESLGVPVDDRMLFVCVAYFTDDSGQHVSAWVNRHLFKNPVNFTAPQIRQWEDPVHLDLVYPPQLTPDLCIVVPWVRQWVRQKARAGWYTLECQKRGMFQDDDGSAETAHSYQNAFAFGVDTNKHGKSPGMRKL